MLSPIMGRCVLSTQYWGSLLVMRVSVLSPPLLHPQLTSSPTALESEELSASSSLTHSPLGPPQSFGSPRGYLHFLFAWMFHADILILWRFLGLYSLRHFHQSESKIKIN
jgi:hypothetical protein